MLLSDFYPISKSSYYIPVDRLSIHLTSSLTKKSNTEVASNAAEILYLLAGFGKKLTRQDVSDLLFIPYTNLQRPLELLKDKNLIYTKGKKFIFTGDLTQIATEENIFEIYAIIYGDAVDWYSDREKHYALINLMHTISTWVGLGVPISERRRLTKCLCFDCFNCCTDKYRAQAKKDLLTLKKDKLQKRFDNDNYSNTVLDRMEFRKEKNIRLHYFNLAKKNLYLIRKEYYTKGIRQDFISFAKDEIGKNGKEDSVVKIDFQSKDIVVDALMQSIRYFPERFGISMKITMDKRIKYLLEYLVYQPLSGDKDFSPFSPFYGKDLTTRLGIIQDTIGKDTKYYSGVIEQEQLKEAVNCSEEGNRRISLNEEWKENVIYEGRNWLCHWKNENEL